jgi:solute:Na+ symporter, SSS family
MEPMIVTTVLFGYALLLIAIGVAVSRNVRGTEDFFVARRRLGAGLLFSTLLAANIGAGSTVGATGLAYRIGFSAWWWVGSAGLGSAILAFTVGPRIWRIARDHELQTLGDYLELRFDRRVRMVAAALLWVGSLSILAGQFIAVAWILHATLGVSKPPACGIAALITASYFAAGGLHASARVNVLQLVVKLAGFAAAFWFLLRPGNTASVMGLSAAVEIGWPAILRYLLILAPAFIVSPGILQKVFAARSASAVRTGVWLNAAGLLLFACIPGFMGTLASSRFVLDNAELALPTLLMNALPRWLGGLLLGAILSAELSAADAVLFMLTTSLTKDLYLAYLRPQASEAAVMKFARAAALACGAAAGLIGILLPTVISALTIFYTLLTAALFLPIISGIYTAWVSANTALATMSVSVLATFTVEILTRGAGLWGAPSLGVGLLCGAAVMGVLSSGTWSSPTKPISGARDKTG